jgi:hypothetical protein
VLSLDLPISIASVATIFPVISNAITLVASILAVEKLITVVAGFGKTDNSMFDF